MTEDLQTLNLTDLLAGMPGLTHEIAASFVQAASVCLEGNNHMPGVTMSCAGWKSVKYQLHWPSYADPQQVARAWADTQYATEYGAYGVAIALVQKLTSKVVWERSAKGTGFDFWLCDTADRPLLFQGTARLEVSGIFSGNVSRVASRTRQKVAQVAPSNGTGLDAYVVVVEFGGPQAKVAYE